MFSRCSWDVSDRLVVEDKKDWSLGEWINNFIQDDGLYDDDLYDDIYDDTMPGGDAPHYGDGDDDGFIDTLVIMVLAVSLAFFVYYRQQRERAAEQARRQREAQQAGQQGGIAEGAGAPVAAANNNGLFPPVGDPNFNQWVAGGVGN